MSAQHLFITGLHRSGTTLLEKLVHNHPGAAVASQPAPFLYYHLKQAFLHSRKLERQYPIDPQFPEHNYQPEKVTSFLKQHQLQETELHNIFRQMKGYEAQYSPELLRYGHELRAGTFADVYQQICDLTRYQAPEKQVTWRGTKEIIGEEFIPVLAEAGVKCLLVIRDPRDMLLSTNSGRELGQVRPTLYYLRMWRKSVAFAIGLQHHPNVLVLRYEDLVQQPQHTLASIAGFLGIESFPAAAAESPIVSQSGASWEGNSAFGQLASVNTAPAGRFRQHFSADTIQLAEAFCYPEMGHLGYYCDQVTRETYGPELIWRQKETFTVTHRNFRPDYTHSPENLQQEVHRAELLLQPAAAATDKARPYFIYEEAYQALRQSLKN